MASQVDKVEGDDRENVRSLSSEEGSDGDVRLPSRDDDCGGDDQPSSFALSHGERTVEPRSLHIGLGGTTRTGFSSECTTKSGLDSLIRLETLSKPSAEVDGSANVLRLTTEAGVGSLDGTKGKKRSKAEISPKIHLTDNATLTPAELELWENLERTMSAKQTQVLQVLEDFGIADVEPQSDELEEQIWRVVQGEITFQEAVDLV